MTVRDVAIVGRNNRYGLTRDAEILRQGLVSIGVRATLFDKRSWMDRLRRREVVELVVRDVCESLGVTFGSPEYGSPKRVRP